MNILMATMSLDIGGAETHIVELAKELIRRGGYSITVVSNGGVYASELEAYGIKHVKAPLHTKNLRAVIKSYRILKKLLSSEQFDIVHAHARIPAFICGLLCGRRNIKFVTTAHGVFKVTPYWRLLSNWGGHALAVSYDIKQYLIDRYAMPSDNITVTINGIDTDQFTSDVGYADIAAEFDFRPVKNHRVVHVSRIDKENADIAFQLVEAAPGLFALYDDLEIVIVGSGTALGELQIKADNMNRLLGSQIIKLAGKRTDVNKFLASAGVFVGVSRAALEAMSAEIPVVLTGFQGSLGVFGDDIIKAALDTNFTCRGYQLSDTKRLLSDINAVFQMTDTKRAQLGVYNRSVILDKYSIKRMADDAVSAYEKTPSRPGYKYGDVIMSGYYGFGNMGDDSLLLQIIKSLRTLKPDIKITVLSKSPSKTTELYGVKAVNRFNFFAVLHAIKHGKLLVNGGGNLLQNKTSRRSLRYYLYIINSAKKRGLKVMLYASGIGPLYGDKDRNKVRDALNNSADLITLRESASLDELKTLGVTNANVHVTCDPAFYLESAAEDWVKYIMFREGLSPGKRYFMVAPRDVKDNYRVLPADFYDKFAEACQIIAKKYKIEPVIVPLQPKMDQTACEIIAAKTGGKIVKGLSASELCGLAKCMEFVAGMRLHMLIYAASVETPPLAVDCDPKITALFKLLELPYIIEAEQFSVSKFTDMTGALINNSERVRTILSVKAREMRSLSTTDTKYALELLGDGDAGMRGHGGRGRF